MQKLWTKMHLPSHVKCDLYGADFNATYLP